MNCESHEITVRGG